MIPNLSRCVLIHGIDCKGEWDPGRCVLTMGSQTLSSTICFGVADRILSSNKCGRMRALDCRSRLILLGPNKCGRMRALDGRSRLSHVVDHVFS